MTEHPSNPTACYTLGLGRLELLLHAFAGRKILVVGDLVLDEYIWGQTNRLSPEAPVPVIDAQRTTHTLGGAANVAGNVRKMGAEVTVAGVVGADSNAEKLLTNLKEIGSSTDGVTVDEERPTTIKTRIVAQHQQIVRIDRESRQPLSNRVVDELLPRVTAVLPRMDAVVLSDYAKGVLTERLVKTVTQKAKQFNIPVAANLKPPRVRPFHGATLLTLNLAEAERAWGRPIANEESFTRCGCDLQRQLACNGLLITRGGDGVTLFGPEAAPQSIPARRVQVFDVTGAGDTVISAAAMALAAGASCVEATAVGNLAGNIKVTKLGTAAVDCDEIRDFAKNIALETQNNEYHNDLERQWRAAA